MRRLLLIFSIILLSISGTNLQAQDKKGDKPRHEMRREMQEYKMKFLAKEMGISGEKQAKFFEAYIAFAKTQDALFEEMRKARNTLERKSNPADADYESFRKTQNSVKDRETAADAEYRKALDKILTPRETFLLQEGENKFREKMQELKAKHKSRGHKPVAKN